MPYSVAAVMKLSMRAATGPATTVPAVEASADAAVDKNEDAGDQAPEAEGRWSTKQNPHHGSATPPRLERNPPAASYFVSATLKPSRAKMPL